MKNNHPLREHQERPSSFIKRGRPFRSLKGPGLEGVIPLWSWGATTELTGLAAFGGQEGEVGHAQDIRGKLA